MIASPKQARSRARPCKRLAAHVSPRTPVHGGGPANERRRCFFFSLRPSLRPPACLRAPRSHPGTRARQKNHRQHSQNPYTAYLLNCTGGLAIRERCLDRGRGCKTFKVRERSRSRAPPAPPPRLLPSLPRRCETREFPEKKKDSERSPVGISPREGRKKTATERDRKIQRRGKRQKTGEYGEKTRFEEGAGRKKKREDSLGCSLTGSPPSNASTAAAAFSRAITRPVPRA